jgi:hypothetical protein
MHPDYLKLAEYYGSFLAALGGVSITVLALVLSVGSSASKQNLWVKLAFKRVAGKKRVGIYPEPLAVRQFRAILLLSDKSPGQKYRTVLIITLIVSTLASFTGAHMMAETAALSTDVVEEKTDACKDATVVNKGGDTTTGAGSGVTAQTLGERHFFLAGVNIYIAAMLLILALVLLAAEHGEAHPAVQLVSIAAFIFIIASVLGWMYLSVTSRAIDPLPWWQVIGAFGVWSAVWIRVSHLWFWPKGLIRASFAMIIASTAVSLFFFAKRYKHGGQADFLDKWIFTDAIIISSVSLLAIGFKLRGIAKIKCWPQKIRSLSAIVWTHFKKGLRRAVE